MENNDKTKKMLELLEKMQVKKDEDKDLIEEIKEHLKNNEIPLAMKKLQVIKNRQEKAKKTKKSKNVQFLGNKKNNTVDEVSSEEVDPRFAFGDIIEEKSSDDINIDDLELPFE